MHIFVSDQQAAGPAAPNKLKRLLEISKTSNDGEGRLKVPKSVIFLNYFYLSLFIFSLCCNC